MIHNALDSIKNELDAYVKLVTGLSDSKVVLSNILNQDGTSALPADKIGITLVTLEEERMMKAQSNVVMSNGMTKMLNPELKLNLYALFSSNFTDYYTALKYLSYVVTFFQGKNVFDHKNTPNLDPSIERLILDIMNESTEQQKDLWQKLGAKYLPSVTYRIRMLVVQANMVQEERIPIEQINIEFDNI